MCERHINVLVTHYLTFLHKVCCSLAFCQGTNQHDVQELNRILFSALEHSLVGTAGSAFIQRLYHGTTVNSIVCRECGNVSQRQVGNVRTASLPISNFALFTFQHVTGRGCVVFCLQN